MSSLSVNQAKLPDYPLFATINDWYPPDTQNHEEMKAHYTKFHQCWEFLKPAFAEHGYVLYDNGPQQFTNYPPTQTVRPADDMYPYGRRPLHERDYLRFITPVVRSMLAFGLIPRSYFVNSAFACGQQGIDLDVML